MAEHWIRLRGGWEYSPLEDDRPVGPARRLALPIVWPADAPTAIQLARRFQRPPLNPYSETLWLRMDEVPGLLGVYLNGDKIAEAIQGETSLLVKLDDLPGRNRLILDLRRVDGGEWGSIALVIQERDDCASLT